MIKIDCNKCVETLPVKHRVDVDGEIVYATHAAIRKIYAALGKSAPRHFKDNSGPLPDVKFSGWSDVYKDSTNSKVSTLHVCVIEEKANKHIYYVPPQWVEPLMKLDNIDVSGEQWEALRRQLQPFSAPGYGDLPRNADMFEVHLLVAGETDSNECM